MYTHPPVPADGSKLAAKGIRDGETAARWTALTAYLPSAGDAIHRDPILLLVTANDVLSLAPHPLDLLQLPAKSGALWRLRSPLAMKLGDSPRLVTLGQVACDTLVLRLAVLYAFMARGWLP